MAVKDKKHGIIRAIKVKTAVSSGIKVKTYEETLKIVEELDKVCFEYKNKC